MDLSLIHQKQTQQKLKQTMEFISYPTNQCISYAPSQIIEKTELVHNLEPNAQLFQDNMEKENCRVDKYRFSVYDLNENAPNPEPKDLSESFISYGIPTTNVSKKKINC